MRVIYTFGMDKEPVDIEFRDFVSWLRRLAKTLGNGYSLRINVEIGADR